jgi:hypothetical protein
LLTAATAVFFDEGGVALNILGMFLAVPLPVLSPGSIGFLLLRIHATKVIRMARSPFLIGLSFLLSATFLPTTGCLSFFEARVGNEQAETKRAPLLLWHKGFSPGLQALHEPSMRGA